MSRPAFSIYDASAGSGKTYTLVREYLKIILSSPDDDAYRRILAITFTNKAVHEMKSRIVGSLSAFTAGEPDAKTVAFMKELALHTGLTVGQIQEKSRRIIRHIIHNYAAFDISTIDKFTHRVIRTFAHDLNLPSMFDVSLDTENLLAEAVDALIAQAGEDETLTKLLVDFTMEKTDDDKSWDISREIMETGRLILNENNRNEILHLQDRSVSDFIEIREKLAKAADCLEDDCVEAANEAFALLEAHGVDLKSFSASHFPNHIGSIRDKKYNPKNKRYFLPEDVRVNKTAADIAIIESIIPQLLEMLAKIYENYEKRDFYHAFLKNITPLSLLGTVGRELKKIQEEQNILSISEFNRIINDEIRNQPAPFIYERMGERYRHFFIDEFQDTSEMQWQNLIPLIDNATSSQDLDGIRGSLMIVGDPKQSIYRWRGGKAEQFISLGKGHHPFNNPERTKQTLDTNWRSHSQVVEFNNDFFEMIADEFENEDYKDLYANNSRQKTTDKNGGYITITFVSQDEADEEDTGKTELYLKEISKRIEWLQEQGFQYKDIAILTRKREHGVFVARHLTSLGIRIISSETLQIESSGEVRFIINILRYLRNLQDAESKAGFLQHIASKQEALPVHDFISAGMQKDENALYDWLARLGYDFSFSDLRKKSLYETVQIIASTFINSPDGYVQYFLDIVLERDLKAQAGISDFLNFWAKNSSKFSIPSPENTNAVRIMTIHKSKGLEFPVVIFPFAEEDYGRKPKDRLWLEADEELFGLPKVLIDNSKAVENYGSTASAAYGVKKQEELLDNINVLYVALTRAEEQLHIISAMNLTKNGEAPTNNMSAFFINYLTKLKLFDANNYHYEFGTEAQKTAQSKQHEDPLPIQTLRTAINAKFIRIAAKESMMWGTMQQKSIEYGNVVHEILSLINDRRDIGRALETAVENGLIPHSEVNLVELTIKQILDHQELQPFFSEGNKILNEQAIIRKEGSLIKPDRIVINGKNEVYLLDYKTGAQLPKHHRQLQMYQDALESMGYSVVKKSLVYIGPEVNILNL